MHTSQSRGDGPRSGGVSRLGGARADFVASLGRKVADLRVSLARVKATPDEAAGRDELRRKLHALGSGAKLMKFDAMERALVEGIAALDRPHPGVALDAQDLGAIEQLVEDLPALAWGDGPTRSSLAEEKERAKAIEPTHTALIVGQAALADALLEPSHAFAPVFGCESTPDTQAAYDLARSVDPDLVVLDADLPYATELVEALMDDPATERIPVVVVGSFLEPSEAARYVAMGVARTITKPTSREALRDACEETVDARSALPATHAILGEPTLEELGEKLAQQIKDALLAGVDPKARARRIALGAGAEVLAPVWGAIARVREVVTARTDGDVRFPVQGPEGALAIAPSLADPDLPYDSRARARVRGPAGEVRLTGRRVVVADDDPAVVWFLADLLKTAGCVVHEAFDGKQALEAAYTSSPDIVLSDILMPEIDGFSLCRALRRDVALRDVPVVLLSWKEDLLQRVRELGANAAGYVRKESDTRAILARMREALRPRAHVETRLRDEQEVRGRLDGVSVRTLLEIVCATRPEARVSVRDASFLYEVEVRWGAPQKAIRTSGDGSVRRGPSVLAAMLGISAGRFTVATSTSTVEPDLDGSLAAQLAGPVARARAATALLTGPRMMTVERVELDGPAVEDYLRATPKGAKDLVERLAHGAAPRDLVIEGIVDPSLLEDVVSDLAARGLVSGVTGNGGADLFAHAVKRARRWSDTRAQLAPVTPTPAPTSADDVVAPARAACTTIAAEEPICDSPLPGEASTLADAVRDEVSHASPEPMPMERASSVAPAVAAAFELSPPAPRASWEEEDGTPSREEILALAEPTSIDDTAYGEDAAPEPSIRIHEASLPIAAKPTAESDDHDVVAEPGSNTPFSAVTATKTATGETDDAAPVKAPSKLRLWPMLVFVVAAAIVGWAFLRSAGMAPSLGAAPGAAPRVATDLPVGGETGVTYGAAPADSSLAPGQGVLEITASPEAVVVVDGTERGKGAAHVPLAAGPHDVRVKPTTKAPAKAVATPSKSEREDDERGCAVEVRAGRVARVRF